MENRRDVEHRFDVPPGVMLPDLAQAEGVAAVSTPRESHHHATYYDTDDLRLASHHITLRRRAGGEGPGWHLKVQLDNIRRTELWLPLDTGTTDIPEPLARQVRAVALGHDLMPVAVVRTTRTECRLLNENGDPVALLTDDHVHGERVGVVSARKAWRELEIELMDDDTALLDSISARLESAGLRLSLSTSKLDRVLSDQLPRPATPRAPGGRRSAGQVVLAHLREQVDDLLFHDLAARRELPDAVRKMRIATRRLRSAFANFRPLLDRRRAGELRGELSWLATALGGIRDVEMLVERLRSLLGAQPDGLIVGPVRQRIDATLGEAHARAQGDLRSALDGERYPRLVDALETLLAEPPLTARAHRAAARVLPDLLASTCRGVTATAAAADNAADREKHDHLLGEVRTAAERAWHAAESVTPVAGITATRIGRRMRAVQEALEEHRDSVVARTMLWELGRSAQQAGDDGFTFGLLHGLERSRAESAERAYRRVIHSAVRRGWHREWPGLSSPTEERRLALAVGVSRPAVAPSEPGSRSPDPIRDG